MVHIDSNKGILGEKGFTAMIYGSKTLTMYPITGYLISGFKIPFFKTQLSDVKNSHNEFQIE